MNLSIKNVPEDVLSRLRSRAKRNRRSLQGEVLTILDDAVSRQGKGLSTDELIARINSLGFSSPSEAVEMVREDRDR